MGCRNACLCASPLLWPGVCSPTLELLVSGDPLKDIAIPTKPEGNLALIMKDGTVYKNTIR